MDTDAVMCMGFAGHLPHPLSIVTPSDRSVEYGYTGGQQGSFKLTLTHEEMSQMISTSRETVTRVLTRFRKAKLIEIHGATLVVRDPAGLRRIAGGQEPAEAPATRVVALPSASRSDSRLPGFARRERSGSSQLRVALAAD